MAVRAVHPCSLFRSSPPPPLAAALRWRHRQPIPPRTIHPKLGHRCSVSATGRSSFPPHGGVRGFSVHSFVDSVMEELDRVQKRRRHRPGSKMKLTSGELLEDTLQKQTLQRGFLLEFKKDSERVLLAVAQKPDGKKNWMVSDQNGVTSSIKPQQITFVVPGAENFNHTEISEFVQKAEDNLDPSLLEFAWIELLEKNKSFTVEEFAEMIFGSVAPLESYCAHLLLSKDEIYFTVLETIGSSSVYGPRPAIQDLI